jgi:peptidoglycan/LPS O-acetylase OafA/YrhL
MPSLAPCGPGAAVSKESRLPELDGLRGIAVCAVILFHCAPHVFTGGWLGVDVFFVLSGYLITALLVTEHQRTGTIALRAFYARRALRLLPALLVLVAAHFIYSLARPDSQLADVLWTHGVVLLYASNWARAFEWNVDLGALAHTWSLAIEEQFYLVWPLLIMLLLWRKTSLRAASAITAFTALAVAAWRAALFASGCGLERVYSASDTRCDGLLLGSAAALYVLSGGQVALTSRRARALGLTWIVVSLWALFTVDFQSAPVYLGLLAAFTIGCAAVLPSVVTAPGRWTSACLRWRPLVWTGQISYGLYLWNLVVIECVPFPASWRLRLHTLAVIALTFGLAALSYVLVERPFLRLKKRFAGAKLPAPEPVVPTLTIHRATVPRRLAA